jgi:xylan 1,4-beta-xylosidase
MLRSIAKLRPKPKLPREMKNCALILLLACMIAGCKPEKLEPFTYCNPLNLSYRFCTEEPSRREAADPSVVRFRDLYFLFVSKSGGYWYSSDLKEWKFIETNEIPVEEYAPTVVAINDTLYFLASSRTKSTMYKSGDPLGGKWSVAREELEVAVWDPAFFLDDDNRLYLYWGCSNAEPTYGVELDYKNNFSFIGRPVSLIPINPAQYGWEVPGDYNQLINQGPWIEGSWMNKHNGKYYLQYACPGTEFKCYADAVYVSDKPLGPYTVQPFNPFSSKPGGFADGAGHGSTFEDDYGNFWHIGTVTISQKHIFERRLALYPAFFDANGTLYASTKFGDYPRIMPDRKISSFEDIFPGWMLLSYKSAVKVSSTADSLPPSNICDEDIRTYWSAATGNAGEFAEIDLGSVSDVYAVQINFAEHNTSVLGRKKDIFLRYTLEYSTDGENWSMLADRSTKDNDNSHDYIQLPGKTACSFLKVVCKEMPTGNFALSGFRVFGKGNGNAPSEVMMLEARRNETDRRSVSLNWTRAVGATGYNISYGVEKDKLYGNFMVYGDTSLVMNSLNSGKEYYFSIESFNRNGITGSRETIKVE